MVVLCVYSHSDFFDILKIQVDYIKSLNIPCLHTRFPDRETLIGKMINEYLSSNLEIR